MSSELNELQLRAFDEQLAQVPADKGWLHCNGRRARVVQSPVRNSRLLQEAGYLSSQTVSVDIKRTDFDTLKLTHSSTATLDGRRLRPVDINDDPDDAIVNVVLTTRH